MKNGTILLPRTVLATPLWQDAAFGRLWTWRLLAAGRRARMGSLGGAPARLAAGELAVTWKALLQATGLGAGEVHRCLSFGKKIGRLAVRATPWGLRITIVNWQEHLQPQPGPDASARR